MPQMQKRNRRSGQVQEVVIHAPELAGPKDSKGVSVLKPIKRKEFELTNLQLMIASGLGLITVIAAISARFAFDVVPWWYLALGVVSLSYPVAWAGYAFLRDDELGGYFGKELAIRLGACSAFFALTWGLYWGLAFYLGNKSLAQVDGISFAIFLALMLGIGAFASLASLEMEFGQSLLHYALYLGITILLALTAGAEIAEPLSGGAATNPYGLPSVPKLPK